MMNAKSYTAAPALIGVALLAACAVNPATGERQFSLISENQEIQMGREYDPQIVATMGVVDDPELSEYVSDLGQRLAAVSERPDLPWTFRVVDDPAVNAFAVPGGFIYVTRGILARFASEAELVGVLGHEIGHVTARHSVTQMSRQQLLGLGLGVGMILSEDFRRYGGLAQGVVQILNLSYSRGDESQADELGFRYMTRVDYDPNALVGVFQMLAGVSGGASARAPEWQLTHPYPENREADIERIIAQSGEDFSRATVDRVEYLDKIDGVVFGPNPREGYFEGSDFLHPELAFRLQFPSGWSGVNQKTQVGAVSPDDDAIMILSLAQDATSAATALATFLAQNGVTGGSVSRASINGLPAARASFQAQAEDQQLEGEAAFVEYDGNIYQMLGYATTARWSQHRARVAAAISSFRPLTDRAILSVQPARLDVVRLGRSMTVREFLRDYPSSVPDADVAGLNRVGLDDRLAAGTRMKRVVGGPTG